MEVALLANKLADFVKYVGPFLKLDFFLGVLVSGVEARSNGRGMRTTSYSGSNCL